MLQRCLGALVGGVIGAFMTLALRPAALTSMPPWASFRLGKREGERLERRERVEVLPLLIAPGEVREASGVRMALGSTRGGVAGLALRQGLGFVGLGLVLGLPLAPISARTLRSLLLGISPADPASIVGVVVLLAIAGLLAGSGPALRAARTDPLELLRVE